MTEKSAETGTIGIIAGNGLLPFEIANRLTVNGRNAFLIGIAGEVGEAITGFPHEVLEWGKLGRLFKLLAANGIRDVVFAGGVTRRPEVKLSKLDWGAIRTLPEILAFMIGGDNTVLTGTIALFEKRGFRVLGVPDVVPELLVRPGANTPLKISKKDLARVEHGFRVTKTMGQFDIGQGAVIVAGRAVALEGIEGTDDMLSRIADLRAAGRLPVKRGGVLVKTLKPGQDLRADLPTIGPQTIVNLANAGLIGMGVEAGRTIVINRTETFDLANEYRIFVYGHTDDNNDREPTDRDRRK